MNKIGIIGGGNLGKALALGLLSSGEYRVQVSGRKEKSLLPLSNAGITTFVDNRKLARENEIIILCVQPQQFEDVLKEINPELNENHLVISTVTGLKIFEIRNVIGNNLGVIRAMPNTASAISQSMTCLATDNVNEKQLGVTKDLFSFIGKTLVIEEELMQAATVLGASGIAFFMRFIRAITQGGIQMGFHSHDAQFIAAQTALGAAELLQTGMSHPELEIDKVTTPRGCTISGLNEMEHRGLSSAVIKGLMASFEKISNIK